MTYAEHRRIIDVDSHLFELKEIAGRFAQYSADQAPRRAHRPLVQALSYHYLQNYEVPRGNGR